MNGLSSRVAAAAVVALLATPVAAHAAPGDLSTLAGGAGSGVATDLGMVPSGLAADGGTLIVGDTASGTLRKVDLGTGTATPIAGIGAAGFGADGLLATLTALPGSGNSYVGPQQIALAPGGDVLVAVGGGSTVRRIDAASGRMTVIAGNGTYSAAGDGDGELATAVSLGAPYGVAVDAAGGVLIADTGAGRVRRVDPESGRIGTLAAGLSSPYHLAVAADGSVLVAEYGGNRVRRIAADGTVSTLAGTGAAGSGGDGGPATAATLNRPWGVAALGDGSVAVSESAGGRVRLIAPDGEISTLAAGLAAPAGVAPSPAGVFVAESGSAALRVRELDLAGGAVRTVAGNGSAGFSGEGVAATDAQLSSPWGVTVAPDGRIVVADTTSFRIRAIGADGRIGTLAGSGVSCPSVTDPACVGGVPAAAAKLVRPWDVAVAPDGGVYLLESNAAISRLSRLDPGTGLVTAVAGGAPGYAGDGGPAAAARFGEAQGVAVAPDGRSVYVADTGNARVRRIDVASGTIETVAGTGVRGDAGDGGQATAGQLSSPTDVAVTPAGDLLIADAGNRRVRRVDAAAGTIETVASGLASVRGVAAGPRGEIAVADSTGHSVYVVGATVTRVAGAGSGGFDGERGGRLSGPASLAFTRAGDLVVADTGNNRLRRVELSTGVEGNVGGTVPATLALTLGAPASFGTFVPGAGRTYSATTAATVTSTAAEAALTVTDPGPSPGHLRNGAFALAEPLRVDGAVLPATVRTYPAPVSGDHVDLVFSQSIGAGEPLRTGTYAKTLLFTLSTTTP